MRPLADQISVHESVHSEQSCDTAQHGVKRLEAISSTWTRSGLAVAYIGIALLAFATSLEVQTTGNLTIFATSAFSSHSLVATVGVVQAVVLSVAKPPMSKIADVLGRFEAFTISIILYIAGYIQQAASNSVGAYAAAQIFYAAGSTGLQILIQIFVADTSDLLNRALCSTLPQLPFLFTVWIGPEVAQTVLRNFTWRLGYAIWVLVLPVAFLPLALALVINQRKAARRGLLPPSQFEGKSAWGVVKTIWYELDLFGLLLICAAFSLILIPLTLAAESGWDNSSLITMLAVGGVCLIAFPFWERSKTLAPRAFFPRDLFKQRTVVVGLALAFFYFMAFYLSIYPYFQSYLLVVHNLPVATAGKMVQTFTFSATVTSLVISFAIKRTKHYKSFVVLGSIIYLIGLGLMMGYRTEGSPLGVILATQIIVGIGGGMLNVPAQLGVQASATHQEVASATAVFLTILEIGGAIGNAISGAIWTNNVPQKLALYLPTETKSQAGAIYANITLAADGWPMGSTTRMAINRAYQETMTQILFVAVCVAAPCVVLSLFMKNYKLDEIDQHVKGLVIGGTQDIADRRESASVAGGSSRIQSEHLLGGNDDDDEDDDERRSLISRSRKRPS
ncbi:putative siderophore-dependent iron transporter [Neohortaea acidophila]|uniref:Putative siderophore-dependent iron transporter n=1 Tax=Neohortaea acidophila TaxID=245834 RepID=A0A6A6PNN4_9PEZI|nr:putative siderophore-dependent iron transporter [Neohortaea acidophila]KAF2481708.1 putative siderophore-dependent iron transporter [Neohortaea acidophila]